MKVEKLEEGASKRFESRKAPKQGVFGLCKKNDLYNSWKTNNQHKAVLHAGKSYIRKNAWSLAREVGQSEYICRSIVVKVIKHVCCHINEEIGCFLIPTAEETNTTELNYGRMVRNEQVIEQVIRMSLLHGGAGSPGRGKLLARKVTSTKQLQHHLIGVMFPFYNEVDSEQMQDS